MSEILRSTRRAGLGCFAAAAAVLLGGACGGCAWSSCDNVRFSPDGKHIAYTRYRGRFAGFTAGLTPVGFGSESVEVCWCPSDRPDQVRERQIECARHVTGGEFRARFRPGPGKTFGRARIEHLAIARFQRLPDSRMITDGRFIQGGVEHARWPGDRSAFGLKARVAPRRQPAVEDDDISRAEHAERPPHARAR